MVSLDDSQSILKFVGKLTFTAFANVGIMVTLPILTLPVPLISMATLISVIGPSLLFYNARKVYYQKQINKIEKVAQERILNISSKTPGSNTKYCIQQEGTYASIERLKREVKIRAVDETIELWKGLGKELLLLSIFGYASFNLCLRYSNKIYNFVWNQESSYKPKNTKYSDLRFTESQLIDFKKQLYWDNPQKLLKLDDTKCKIESEKKFSDITILVAQ